MTFLSRSSQVSLKKNTQAFTLVELILSIGVFAFITAILLQNLFSIYRFRELIDYKKEVNLEASLLLNNGLAGLFRSGFGIHYSESDDSKSQFIGRSNPTYGLKAATDSVAIYLDRPGTKSASGQRRYFKVYREVYQSSGVNSDTARLMVQFSDGVNPPTDHPLHSSELVIEEFDVVIPKKPATESERDHQPYVTLYLRARRRYPNGDTSTLSHLPKHKQVTASYRTTYLLRNHSF